MGGERSFAETGLNGEVAPIPDLPALTAEPISSTRNRPSGSKERGGSLLRKAGEAQAGDYEF